MLPIVEQSDVEAQPIGAAYSPAEIEAMQRTMGAIFPRWGVSDVDAAVILGGISPKTFRRWRDGEYGRVNRDLADRMSYVLGIHKALRIIFAEPAQGLSLDEPSQCAAWRPDAPATVVARWHGGSAPPAPIPGFGAGRLVTPPVQGDHFRNYWNGRTISYVRKMSGDRAIYKLGTA